MADDWEERVRGIAGALLTLEINTIEKSNMSAAKMPDVPLALHELVALYEGELIERHFRITDELLQAAQDRLKYPDDPAREQALDTWAFKSGDKSSANLTNGPKTFEALAWAALAAKRQIGDLPALASIADTTMLAAASDRGLLQRILTNCRQLRQVTLLLTQQFPAAEHGVSLFDGTIEQTTAVMFKDPRPALVFDTDVLMLIRKAWDIGLENVMFQTAMQVDGDVLVRVTPGLDTDRRTFYAELHRSTVETGIRQWQSLFQLLGGLVTQLGKSLFSRGV
jgi:hypothetical protein